MKPIETIEQITEQSKFTCTIENDHDILKQSWSKKKRNGKENLSVRCSIDSCYRVKTNASGTLPHKKGGNCAHVSSL